MTSGAKATTALAIALLFAGALGGVAVMIKYSRTAPVEAPGAEAPPDEGSPTGGEPDAYRATVVRTFERAGAVETDEIVFARRGDASRREWTEGDRRFADIVRPDRGVAWLVDLARNDYVERRIVPPAPGSDAAGDDAAGVGAVDPERVERLVAESSGGAVVTRTRGGTERVAGHDCIVFTTRAEAATGGVTTSTVWEAADLGGLALRSESRGPDGSVATTELRDVSVDVDQSLFEPPSGGRRVDSLALP